MIIAHVSEILHRWMGWCPNAPALRTTTTVLATPAITVNPLEPDPGTRGPRRIVRGIALARESIRTLLRDKQLLWFPALTSLVILFMMAANTYYIAHIFQFLPLSVSVPVMNSYFIFDVHLFLIQGIGIFFINFLLAGLILCLSSGWKIPLRQALSKARLHTLPILEWSMILSFLVTVLFYIVQQNQIFGYIGTVVPKWTFFIPFVYYIPDALLGALSYTFIAMLVTVILLVLTLFVVPVMVLENGTLPGAIVGSFRLFRRMWAEIAGSVMVFVLVALGISLGAVIITMSPAVVGYDLDFFHGRGKMLMIGVCYLYLVAWWLLMATGSTAAGIATLNLYRYGKTGRMPGETEDKSVEPITG